MQVLVNGHALTHRQDREKMLTGGWDQRINTRYLQEGNNEFIFSHHGRLNYDPHPGGHADVRVSTVSAALMRVKAGMMMLWVSAAMRAVVLIAAR